MRRSGNIMKRYEIEFRKQIKLDIDQIKDFIVKKKVIIDKILASKLVVE